MKRFSFDIKDAVECLGMMFLASIPVLGLGTIFDSRTAIVIGLLLMLPLFLSIVFSLSYLGADKVAGLFGSGLLATVVRWSLLALFVAAFTTAGYDDGGPLFWGSIN